MNTKKPFVEDDFICDSSLNIGQIVEQTTSWLTINPMVGCSLKCAYCFREKWHPESTPRLKTDVDTCIKELINHPLFIPNITPLSANVSSTDALLPKVKKSTFEIIQKLDELGFSNIFGIISKLKLNEKDVSFLKSLKNIRIIVLVSYAEIPKNIEPISTKNRIDNLKLLKESNIPNILYFRPIVKGWNDSTEKITKILKIANEYSTAIAIGGLRLSKEIEIAMKSRNIEVPDMNNIFHPKEMSDDLEKKIIDIYYKHKISIPLYKHTSCAVSYVFKIANYNMLYKKPELNCLSTCSMEQQKTCGIKIQI